MELDSDTLHVCNALMNGTYGAMFLSAWVARRDDRHFLLWGASLVLNALCILGFAFLPRPAPWFGSLLFSGVVTTIVLIWAGMRSFDGRRPFKPSLLALPVVSLPIHALAAQILPRGPASSVGLLLLAATIAMAALYILRHGEDRASLARRICAFALLVYVPIYLVSIAAALTGTYDSADILLVCDQVLSNVFVIALFAITLKRSRRVLEEQALQDGLTGALNRTGLERELRNRPARPFTVLAVDLDHFKSINDRFGHAAGDEVLRRFATLARRLLGPGDLLARTGGEEFVAIVDEAEGERGASVAERLRRLFEETPTPWRNAPIRATVSVGLAPCPAGMIFAEALEAADTALYRAKQAGRNRLIRADANLFPVSA